MNFNGLEAWSDSSYLLQPVLQWNQMAPGWGGANKWTLTAWMIFPYYPFSYSGEDHPQVYPGDEIEGEIANNGHDEGYIWTVGIICQDRDVSSWWYYQPLVTPNPASVKADWALEAYRWINGQATR